MKHPLERNFFKRTAFCLPVHTDTLYRQFINTVLIWTSFRQTISQLCFQTFYTNAYGFPRVFCSRNSPFLHVLATQFWTFLSFFAGKFLQFQFSRHWATAIKVKNPSPKSRIKVAMIFSGNLPWRDSFISPLPTQSWQ